MNRAVLVRRRYDVPSGALTDSHFVSCVYICYPLKVGYSPVLVTTKVNVVFVVLSCLTVCSLWFCKFRFESIVFETFFIERRRVSVTVYQFFSTMVSENGFLLVSGSGRNKFTELDETTKQKHLLGQKSKVTIVFVLGYLQKFEVSLCHFFSFFLFLIDAKPCPPWLLLLLSFPFQHCRNWNIQW